MKNIRKLPHEVNDVPVIFVRDASGRILEKISINELKLRNSGTSSEENQRIKMYRAAIEHYANQNYEYAEILFLRLIETSDVMNYEYYERLANVYRVQNLPEEEIETLQQAVEKMKTAAFPDNLIHRVEARLERCCKGKTAEEG